MGFIKRFLFEHGEKLAFGLIALLCLWSLAGTLSQSSANLVLEDGKVYEVDTEKIDSDLGRLKNRLSSTKQEWQAPPVPNVPDIIRRHQARADAPVADIDPVWLAYNQPPEPHPWIWKPVSDVPTIPPTLRQMPPPAYRTRIEAPTDWSVHVGPKGILVMCKGSEAINYPQEGSVNVALFVDRIGEGKDTLSKQTRDAFLARVAGEAADVATEDVQEGGGFGDFSGFEGFDDGGFAPPRERVETPERRTSGGVYPWPVPAGAPQSLDEFQSRLLEQEEQIGQHERILTDPSTMIPGKWTVLTPHMTKYRSMPDVTEILRTGTLPDPVELDGPEGDTGTDGPGEGPLPERRRPRFFGAEEPDAPPPGAAAPEPAEGGPGIGETSDEVVMPEVEAYEPRWYVWLHKDVDENTVYRYRMAAYCKAKNIPEVLQSKPEYLWFTPYVEMGAMGGRYWALTTEEFGDFVKNEKPDVGGVAVFAQPKKIYTELAESGEPRVLGLRDPETNARTPRATAYLKNNAYSIFTYTDVVLTPVKRRISIVSAAEYEKGTEDTNRYGSVTLKVEALKDVETGADAPEDAPARTETRTNPEEGPDEFGEFGGERPRAPTETTASGDISIKSKTRNYRMAPPEQVSSIKPIDFLKLVGGKAEYDDNGKPVLRDLHAVYGKVLDGVQLEEIGKDGERIGREVWDFATGWGLVDVRRCRVVLKYYNDPAKTDFKNRSEPMKAYVIIRELNPAAGRPPRYKRIIYRLPVQEDDYYTMDVEWEPNLVDMANAKRRERLQLEIGDITDWRAFCARILAEGEDNNPTAGRRIWQLLDEPTQGIIRDGANVVPPDNMKESVLLAINERVLDNKYFYPNYGDQMFPNLTGQVARLVKENPRALSDLMILRRNRLLMDSAFPKLIKPHEQQ